MGIEMRRKLKMAAKKKIFLNIGKAEERKTWACEEK